MVPAVLPCSTARMALPVVTEPLPRSTASSPVVAAVVAAGRREPRAAPVPAAELVLEVCSRRARRAVRLAHQALLELTDVSVVAGAQALRLRLVVAVALDEALRCVIHNSSTVRARAALAAVEAAAAPCIRTLLVFWLVRAVMVQTASSTSGTEP